MYLVTNKLVIMGLIRLEFLTGDSYIRSICEQYWLLDSEQSGFVYAASSIAKELGKNTAHLSKYISQNTLAFHTELNCSICGTDYPLDNRTDFARVGNIAEWVCNSCQSNLKRQEQESSRQVAERRRQLIQEHFILSADRSINISDLSLDNAVYLLSLIRYAASEDFSYLHPLDAISIDRKLALIKQLEIKMVNQLHGSGLIFIHPMSDINAFPWKDDLPNSFYTFRVNYALPVSSTTGVSKDFVAELEDVFQSMDWPEQWYKQHYDLWREVALHECIEYLILCMKDHSFEYKVGDKTIQVINNVLNDFSVSQVLNFIWGATSNAAAYMIRQQIPRQRAANTVVGAIQRRHERAKANNWDVKRYHRDYRAPQSMISLVLFNAVLQNSDEGFHQCPKP